METPPPDDSKDEQVQLLVELHHSSDGNLRTSHRAASPTDAVTLSKWPSGGLVQAAHALFTEWIRHEAYLMAVIMATQEDRDEPISLEDLLQRMKMRGYKMVDQFAGPACEEALERVKVK